MILNLLVKNKNLQFVVGLFLFDWTNMSLIICAIKLYENI